MKILSALGLFLLAAHLLWAQPQPSFQFYPSVSVYDLPTYDAAFNLLFTRNFEYRDTRDGWVEVERMKKSGSWVLDYLYVATVMSYPLSIEERDSIWEELKKYSHHTQMPDRSYIMEPGKILELYDVYQASSYTLLDLNRDSIVDLMMIPRIYSGQLGWKIFANQGDHYEFMITGAGSFVEFIEQDQRMTLRYLYTHLAPGEPIFTQTLEWDFQNQDCWPTPKLYYARQTQMPGAFYEQPVPFKLRRNADVHTSPQAIYGQMDVESLRLPRTHTIEGNIVAQFKKYAGGYVLGQQDGWSFVVFEPSDKLYQSSLSHSMDFNCNGPGALFEPNCDRPFITGWIPSTYIAGEDDFTGFD